MRRIKGRENEIQKEREKKGIDGEGRKKINTEKDED